VPAGASIPSRLDHLVYAAPLFEETLDWFEGVAGVRALLGGVHPKWRTQNAVIPLGRDTYLEIIGPDPSAQGDPPKVFRLDVLDSPRLVTWAAKGMDLATIAARAQAHGIPVGHASTGRRQRPDGSWLTWELTDPARLVTDGLVPFFIDWRTSPHPGGSTLAEVTLEDFHGEHPNPALPAAQLAKLGLDLRVDAGPLPRLVATLKTPRGRMVLD
jgi:hypothetical protein